MIWLHDSTQAHIPECHPLHKAMVAQEEIVQCEVASHAHTTVGGLSKPQRMEMFSGARAGCLQSQICCHLGGPWCRKTLVDAIC